MTLKKMTPHDMYLMELASEMADTICNNDLCYDNKAEPSTKALFRYIYDCLQEAKDNE